MTNSGMQSRDEICLICGTSVTCGIKSILNTQIANKTKLDEKTSEFSSASYKKPAITGCCPWNKVVFNIKYIFLLVSQYNKAVQAFGNKPTSCEFPEFRKAVLSKLRITHSVMCYNSPICMPLTDFYKNAQTGEISL